MAKIELPGEVITFMQELAREIKTQDNRITASPYYYVVMASHEMIAPAGYGDNGDPYYYSNEWREEHTHEDWVEILKQHNEENDDNVEIDEFISGCKEFGMHDVDVEDNVFLTFKGYKDHMRMNGHNYRHLKKPHSYVKHAFRNPEMENLLKAIMAFDTSDVSPEEKE